MQFLCIGLLLLSAVEFWKSRHDDDAITVDQATLSRINEAYRQQFGVAPSADVGSHLVDRYVEDEVLYREGLKLGLDKSDEIVRRRIIAKMRFLTEDETLQAEPDAAALAAFYRRHVKRYRRPGEVTFTHIFFSGEGARERASSALASLADDRTRAPEIGDPFVGLYDLADANRTALERLFGSTRLVDALQTVRPLHWTGPFESAYGWHLVRVTTRKPESVYPLSQVRVQVRNDLLEARREVQNRETLERLKQDYVLTIERSPSS